MTRADHAASESPFPKTLEEGRPESSLNYEEKFSRLNQAMRWEVAELLREAYLEDVDRMHTKVQPSDNFYVRYGKRGIDIGVSSVALLVSLPITLSLVPLILKDLGKPILFSQERIGKDEKGFRIVKLRTMRDGVDEDGRPLLGAMRVTKLGRFIRRTSLDELLNFWSILKGDMSLIGPRPLPPEYLRRYSCRHRQRHKVRPGLDCPTPRPLKEALTYEIQFENDCWYVENVSFLTDLKLVIRLITSALDPRQNDSRGSSSRGIFMGYDAEGAVVTSKEIPMWALDEVLRRNGRLNRTDSDHLEF